MNINSCLKIEEKSLVLRPRSALMGAGVGGERKERKDILKAGQRRGSIVCVSVNYTAK